MKPFIIYSESKDNKVILTKEQFEQYILDAYNTGFADGKKDVNSSIYPTSNIYYKGTGLKPPYEATCISDASVVGETDD